MKKTMTNREMFDVIVETCSYLDLDYQDYSGRGMCQLPPPEGGGL